MAAFVRGLAAFALAVLGSVLFGAVPAQAASADIFDDFDVQATLNSDGTVDVVETITLRFGTSSGRHGLERTLRTREPDVDEQRRDTGQDMLFPITNISAESLTPGVSDMLDITHQSEDGNPRNTWVRLRVGDPDRHVWGDTAAYRLRYRIAGLMRTSGSYDELYWDLTGSDMPRIETMTATISVPGGAQELFCSVARAGERGDCGAQEIEADGSASFAHDGIPRGQVMTISIKVGAGLVSPNTPILQESALAADQRMGSILLGSSAVGAVAVGVGGWAYTRRRTGDRRYVGLPPGVLPAAGQPMVEERDPGDIPIPVAFAPPPLALAEAGLLLDGTGQVKHTTATLVSLAVNGAIKLRSEEPPEARLVDADRAPDKPSKALLRSLFGSRKVVTRFAAGSMVKADAAVKNAARKAAEQGNWFLASGNVTTGSGLVSVVLVPIAGFGLFAVFGSVVLNLWPLALALVITGVAMAFKLSKARRTGTGRALTDQVEGFRTYLATAEAEQLRFEEGEDIFSRYLPWAILFDLTERWTRLCEQLVAMGRLPATPPDWYYGSTWDLNLLAWQMSSMNTHVATAASPPPPSVSDSGWGSGGSAFGGGSSFGGGGGFSGGGGGGGGGGSW